MLILILISFCQHPGGEEVLLEQAGGDLYNLFYILLFILLLI